MDEVESESFDSENGFLDSGVSAIFSGNEFELGENKIKLREKENQGATYVPFQILLAK
jgi:hypothetical protein